jgi:uncharacterized protein (TIRG00374 family)
MSSLTPGRVGEIIRPYYLWKAGFSFKLGFKSIVIDRLSDVAALVLFSGLGFLYFWPLVKSSADKIGVFLAVVLVIFGIASYVITKHRHGIIAFLTNRIPDKLQAKFNGGIGEDIKISELLKGEKWVLSATSIGAIFVTCLKLQVLLLAIQVNVTFIFMILLVSMVTLARFLPISILNLGSREAVIILLFQLRGIEVEVAMAFCVLILIDLLLFIASGQLVMFTSYPKHERERDLTPRVID